MKLWTIIDQSQYDYIQRYGYLRTDSRKICLEFKSSYKWLIGQMIKQIGSQPKNVTYPIWAWAQWEGISQKRPDIRSLRHHFRDGIYYRVEIEIPKNRVVLSNFIDWHYVLNYSYLPFTQYEDDKFDKLLSDNNIEYSDKKNYPTRIKNIIEKTWCRIFDFTSTREYSYVGEINDREIQATFWVLYKNDIIQFDKFKSKETKNYR